MRSTYIVLSLLLASQVLFAQNRLTPELLWELDRVGAPQLSKSGKLLLFTITDCELSENRCKTDIYTLSTNEGERPVKVSTFSASSFSAAWRPDGKKITFLSAESGSVQLYEMNADGTDIEQISNVEGGISGYHYAADMSMVSYSADVEMGSDIYDKHPDLPMAKARIIDNLMYRHWNKWADKAYSHIFAAPYTNGRLASGVDLMLNQQFDSPVQPFGGSEEFAISPDGGLVAYTCKKSSGKSYAESTNTDIYLHNLSNGKTSNLSVANEGYDKAPVFSPDGKKILWLRMVTPGYESDKNSIIVYDLGTGKETDLLAGIDQSADHAEWSADGRRVFFNSGVKAKKHIFSISAEGKGFKQHSKGRYNYGSFALGKKQIYCTRQDMTKPNDLVAIDLKNGSTAALTSINERILSKIKPAKIREQYIKTTDGSDMHVWMILPPDFDSTKRYPTLLYCQGGPQAAISQYFSFRWNFQLMASQGYIIIAPNRHGVPSFGQEWNHQISGDWGGQAMKDYLAATDYAAKLPYVNEDKMGAIGASYGGYSVYWLAGNHQKRFKTFISHCGLFNLESWYGTTEELFFANYDLKGPYWNPKLQANYQRFSPHRYVKNWDTPILVIHSEKDFRVPIGEGLQAFNIAQMKDIPSRFLYFPTEGHWVLSPQNGVLWHREFFEWLDTYLK